MMQRVKRRKEDCKIQRSWIRQHVSSYPANIQLQYQDECIFINILCMLCMGLTLKWATSNHPTLSIYNSNLIIASLCHRADGTVFPLQRMFTFSAAKPTTPFCSAALARTIQNLVIDVPLQIWVCLLCCFGQVSYLTITRITPLN